MRCCRKIDRKFLQISLKLEDEVNRRSLTNVPITEWRRLTIAVNLHLFLASILFISGCVCFCVSLQFSTMFDRVNCSDGINIFPPMLNMITAFTGLFTIRTDHLKWPAFIHLLTSLIVLPLNIITAVDLIVNSFHWDNYWSQYPLVSPEVDSLSKDSSETLASFFLWMDAAIGLVALLNDVFITFILYTYYKFWYSVRSNHVDM